MKINTEVITVVTSAPPGHDHNSFFSDQFSYTISDLEAFAETSALTAPIIVLFQEEAIASIMMDIARIEILYHSIIQRRSISTAASMVIDETVSAPPTMPVMEQTGLQLKPTSDRSPFIPCLQLHLLLGWGWLPVKTLQWWLLNRPALLLW